MRRRATARRANPRVTEARRGHGRDPPDRPILDVAIPGPAITEARVFTNVHIPYRAYWSSPFARWQGSFAGLHSIRFAAHVARRALADRGIAPEVFDHAVMGTTTPQMSSFCGSKP